MSAYGCMECGFSSRSTALLEAHIGRRPDSCKDFQEKIRSITELGAMLEDSLLRLAAEPFRTVDLELEDYWQKIAPLYVREESIMTREGDDAAKYVCECGQRFPSRAALSAHEQDPGNTCGYVPTYRCSGVGSHLPACGGCCGEETEMTDDEKGYSGWTNYETWAMALWIDNEEGTYKWSREMAREIARTDRPAVERSREGELADRLKDWQEELMPELEASVWSDLLRAAFGEIDWYEIAEHYFDEVHEEAEES